MGKRDLIWAYQQLSVLRAWASIIEEEVLNRLMAGDSLEGLKLVSTRPNRVWKEDADSIRSYLMGLGMTEDEVAPRSIVSPSGAERLLKAKKLDQGLVSQKVSRPAGKPTVAPTSDPREEYQRGEEFTEAAEA